MVRNDLRLTVKHCFNLLCNFWDVITSINDSFSSRHSCTDQQSGSACCCPLRLICFQKFLLIKELWSLVPVKFQNEHPVISKLEDTLHKRVNRSLSSSGLVLAAGYSQSRSSPSNPCVLRNWMEDCTKAFLLACVDTMLVNLSKHPKKEQCSKENIVK